jgi:Zn-dependent peptidase ImmA (M78 family)
MKTLNEIISVLEVDPGSFCKEQGFTAPIDLNRVAELLGLTVNFGFPSSEGFSDLAYSGYVRKTNEGVGEVWVNPIESERRQRFTFAHEIGHYVLHLFRDGVREFKDNDATLRRGGAWNIDEYQANKFAAELLMPEYLILEHGAKIIADYKSQNNGNNISVADFVTALSDIFNVSKPAMTYRLKNLKLIP